MLRQWILVGLFVLFNDFLGYTFHGDGVLFQYLPPHSQAKLKATRGGRVNVNLAKYFQSNEEEPANR